MHFLNSQNKLDKATWISILTSIETNTILSNLNEYEEIAALRRGGLEKLDLTWSPVSLTQDGDTDLLVPFMFYLPRSASSLVSLTLRFALSVVHIVT
jgi:hypothetical protein